MWFVHKLPASRTGTNAVIGRLKELLAEHRAPDVLHTDTGLQYASSAFADFASEWHL